MTGVNLTPLVQNAHFFSGTLRVNCANVVILPNSLCNCCTEANISIFARFSFYLVFSFQSEKSRMKAFSLTKFRFVCFKY